MIRIKLTLDSSKALIINEYKIDYPFTDERFKPVQATIDYVKCKNIKGSFDLYYYRTVYYRGKSYGSTQNVFGGTISKNIATDNCPWYRFSLRHRLLFHYKPNDNSYINILLPAFLIRPESDVKDSVKFDLYYKGVAQNFTNEEIETGLKLQQQ